MFFTDRALQQATDELLADYKARRFPAQRAVIDLGCGIGGDLLAIAQRGPTLGVDNDPILALLAAANLQRLRTSRGMGRPGRCQSAFDSTAMWRSTWIRIAVRVNNDRCELSITNRGRT